MSSDKKVLVVDAGNTRIKVALFKNEELLEYKAFTNNQLDKLQHALLKYKSLPGIISSVRSEKNTTWLKNLLPKAILFSHKLDLPLKNNYATPEKLGLDRLANAVAVNHLSENNGLAIDVGTCIKYDFVNDSGTYLGGSISPGIELRFKAMHQFTDRLPLVSIYEDVLPIGNNTDESLKSGVMLGIQHEINGFIERYRQQYPELTIFLTGGDAHYFDFDKNCSIFVDENLTLKGLLIAYLHVQQHII
jgi:type III pantothenate kinase